MLDNVYVVLAVQGLTAGVNVYIWALGFMLSSKVIIVS